LFIAIAALALQNNCFTYLVFCRGFTERFVPDTTETLSRAVAQSSNKYRSEAFCE
jgi:hypothetical protein